MTEQMTGRKGPEGTERPGAARRTFGSQPAGPGRPLAAPPGRPRHSAASRRSPAPRPAARSPGPSRRRRHAPSRRASRSPARARSGPPGRRRWSTRSSGSARTWCSGSRAARSCRPTTRCSTPRSIRHILVRHEQGAGHAATGYAQATGRVGVCMATSGPGATNLVTPIADAYMDSVPIVAITGQVPSSLIGTDGFQEADISGITIPITKHNFLVTKPEDIARTIGEAFHVASTGRPGPGARRHLQGRAAGQHRLRLAGPVRPARLPPGDPAARPAGARGRPADQRVAAAGALRRRRRDQGAGRRPAARARRADRHPGGHHADGPGRVP